MNRDTQAYTVCKPTDIHVKVKWSVMQIIKSYNYCILNVWLLVTLFWIVDIVV